MARENPEVYEFGRFRLDVGEHKLAHADGPPRRPLPDKAFRTLVELVRNSGSLMTKDQIIAAVWPDTIVEENNLGKAIYAVRSFLGDTSGEPEFIETVPKHGYRFIADVTKVAAGASANGNAGHAPNVRSPAYDLYLRGKIKAGRENREETEAAVELLEAAVALDPDLAEAYAQLARVYNTMSFKFGLEEAERKRYDENAEMAIEAALSLKPDLSEGHFARGLILWTSTKRFPHEQAIQSYKRSLELNPNADETHHQLSMVYAHVGLLDEAMRCLRRAIDINPNNTMARFRVSNYTAWQGRFDDALAVLKTIPPDISPLLVERIRGELLIQTGRIDEAWAIVDDYLDRYPKDEGGSLTGVRAVLLAKAGDRERAEKAIGRAVEKGKGFGHFHHTAHNIASAYAALGMLDDAVRWVEAAADDGFPCYPYFQIDPNLAGLRGHPPFVDLMSAMQRQWARLKHAA